MKLLKNHYSKVGFCPVYLQLSKACVLSCFTTCALLFLIPLMKSYIDGIDLSTHLTFMYSVIAFSYSFVITAIMYVPFEALIILLIHYTKIWPFLMYSKPMVLVVTFIFVGLYDILNINSSLDKYDTLWLCSISVVFIFLILRCIFHQRYIIYQKKFIGFYDGKTIDLKSDNIITIVLYLIVISISQFISFVIL